MDFLDPQKMARHRLILFAGYILITIAIVITSLILFKIAGSYGLDRRGNVIQNGLVFFSSQPNPAQIYINGQPSQFQTNSRLVLPQDSYDIELRRSGYLPWRRTVKVLGNDVQHFDYPLLIPSKLTTSDLKAYPAAPAIASQSPDRRWIIVAQAGSLKTFDVYDARNAAKPPLVISLPDSVFASPGKTAPQALEAVEWADDNRRLLLKYNFAGSSEYVLLDRAAPDQSINLSVALKVNTGSLALADKKYDQYFVYDENGRQLSYLTLKNTAPVALARSLLAYKTYKTDQLLYVTGDGAPPGKVSAKLLIGNTTYVLRTFDDNGKYLADFATFNGTPYAVLADVTNNRVYIYKDPVNQLTAQPLQVPVPAQTLKIDNPQSLSFSPVGRFIAAQSNGRFAVYDLETKHSYSYDTKLPLDEPQKYASWMDGHRLYFVSGGRLVEFDYDNQNQHSLVSAAPQYQAFFAPDYSSLLTITPQFIMTRTPLIIP